MSKEVSTKEINAGFLAIVLIVGTLAAISPSFMVGAHAQQYGMDQKYNSYEPDYGMDNSYDDKQSYGKDSNSNDKSKDSSNVIAKKIKCNNINVNVNGFNGIEVGTLPTTLNGLATDEAQASADEGEIGASSFGSGGGSDGRPSSGQGSDKWCINDNEFVVVEAETPEPEPEPPTCVECFDDFLTQEQKDRIFPFFGVENVCNRIAETDEIIDETIFRERLVAIEVLGDIDIELLIDCLERAGWDFVENIPP